MYTCICHWGQGPAGKGPCIVGGWPKDLFMRSLAWQKAINKHILSSACPSKIISARTGYIVLALTCSLALFVKCQATREPQAPKKVSAMWLPSNTCWSLLSRTRLLWACTQQTDLMPNEMPTHSALTASRRWFANAPTIWYNDIVFYADGTPPNSQIYINQQQSTCSGLGLHSSLSFVPQALASALENIGKDCENNK